MIPRPGPRSAAAAFLLLTALLLPPPAAAQASSVIAALETAPPAPPPDAPWTVARGVAFAGALRRDIDVLDRIAGLQRELIALNETRMRTGALPERLSARLCAAAAAAAICGALPYTFGPAETAP